MRTVLSKILSAALLCSASLMMANVQSQTAPTIAPTAVTASQNAAKPQVHIIYMGGNDCPPCVVWRGVELPKLEKTEAFKSVKFSYVTKAIRSPIPSSMFLPEEVKPYKEKLDYASSGRGGSAQVAFIVDGNVYHYFGG